MASRSKGVMSLVFSVKIPAKQEMLSTNRDTLLVDEFIVLDEVSDFQITLYQIGKILHANVVSRVGKLSNF
jgi:hypothetical protein